jgi:adenine-specific DNA-methyltransferase
MPRLEFKGKSLVANHHFGVPYHELLAEAKKGLSKQPKLDDNLIVQGDNLLALKALLPTYAGKVKCIYIDPPYNTGNEGWAYNDAVNSPMMREWLGKTVDKDDLTRHDKWLCMMMPRLKLLRELLSDDGAIFVSIDDNEQHHLRMLMDEVFGEGNFIAEFIWKSRVSEDARAVTGVSTDHEYIFAYSKAAETVFKGVEKDLSKFANPDNDSRGPWRSADLTGLATKENRPNLHYAIVNPKNGIKYECPEKGWRYDKNTMAEKIADGRIIFPAIESGRPRLKLFQNEMASMHKTISSVITSVSTADGTKELVEILGQGEFSFPKPSSLISLLVSQVCGPNDIILDSFAGSGTTAHAVLALNKEDGGKRRFILVEMEDYADKITAERVRRVIKGVPGAKDENLRNGLGGTFSYFKLGEAVDPSRMLEGKGLPRYEQLASYVFHTATGQPFDAVKIDRRRHLIGSTNDYDIHLLYEPDMKTLKELSLNLDTLKELGPAKTKTRLVFAPAKYLDRDQMAENKVEFAQLPFELFRRV